MKESKKLNSVVCELTNPSDAVTFIVNDVRIAGVAILMLGRGAYGLTDPEGNTVVPLCLFGSAEAWLKENDIEMDKLSDFIVANKVAIADFLDTCAYGHIAEREAFDRAIGLMSKEAAATHRQWWNDRNRSSLNNIGEGARALAETLRSQAFGRIDRLPKATPLIAVAP